MPKIVPDDQIFQAAINTVVARGYAGATTKQIAKAAEISEVTLFRKYGTKAELINQAITALASQIDFATAARYTGDISADLLRVVETYQGSASKSGQFIYSILVEIPRHSELADLLDAPFHLMGSIGTLLTRYQEEGVLKKEHPILAMTGLLGPLIAANILKAAAPHRDIPDIDLANHVAFFIAGRRA